MSRERGRGVGRRGGEQSSEEPPAGGPARAGGRIGGRIGDRVGGAFRGLAERWRRSREVEQEEHDELLAPEVRDAVFPPERRRAASQAAAAERRRAAERAAGAERAEGASAERGADGGARPQGAPSSAGAETDPGADAGTGTGTKAEGSAEPAAPEPAGVGGPVGGPAAVVGVGPSGEAVLAADLAPAHVRALPPHSDPYPLRPSHPADSVPWTLRVAAEVIWRVLLVGIGLYVLMRVVSELRVVALAFVAALLVSALLHPTVLRLRRFGLPRALATALTFLGGLVGIGLVAWFVVWQVSTNVGQVSSHIQTGINQIRGWLIHGPLHLTDKQINQFAGQLSKAVGNNSDQITSFGFSTVGVVVEILTGVFLAAFCTFFLLYDGVRIWAWTLRLFPVQSRMALAGAGPRAWATLTAYVRGTVLIAFIDSVSIGIGIYLLGVPLAVPISVLIFLGAFVPLVGALVTGTIAVLIGLVTHGIVTAALVLAVLLAVQQIEGHLLQPLILGRAVRIHPLAVILAVTSGSIIGGIGGAVVAVPLVAVTNTVVGYLRARHHVDEDVRAALAAAHSDHG